MSAARNLAGERLNALLLTVTSWSDREDLLQQNADQAAAYVARHDGDAEDLALAEQNLHQTLAVLDLVRGAQAVAR